MKLVSLGVEELKHQNDKRLWRLSWNSGLHLSFPWRTKKYIVFDTETSGLDREPWKLPEGVQAHNFQGCRIECWRESRRSRVNMSFFRWRQ